MKLELAPLLTTFVLVLPSLAFAQTERSTEPPTEPTAAPPPPPALVPAEIAAPRADSPTRYETLRFGLGFRIGYIGDPGFDTFADSDTLAQMSLDATYAFYTKDKLAIGAGAAWDVGSRTSGARGLTTKLTVHRLSVPIEARWYFTRWLNVFAKVAPGAGALDARAEDPSAPETLEQTPWLFTTDLSAGASFRLVGSNEYGAPHPRLWLTCELGYGFTTSRELRPVPSRNDADVLGTDHPTNLGSLALDGVFWRTGLALSF
jgi:hypothetical protein